jgi:hypothetical protein
MFSIIHDACNAKTTYEAGTIERAPAQAIWIDGWCDARTSSKVSASVDNTTVGMRRKWDSSASSLASIRRSVL